MPLPFTSADLSPVCVHLCGELAWLLTCVGGCHTTCNKHVCRVLTLDLYIHAAFHKSLSHLFMTWNQCPELWYIFPSPPTAAPAEAFAALAASSSRFFLRSRACHRGWEVRMVSFQWTNALIMSQLRDMAVKDQIRCLCWHVSDIDLFLHLHKATCEIPKGPSSKWNSCMDKAQGESPISVSTGLVSMACPCAGVLGQAVKQTENLWENPNMYIDPNWIGFPIWKQPFKKISTNKWMCFPIQERPWKLAPEALWNPSSRQPAWCWCAPLCLAFLWDGLAGRWLQKVASTWVPKHIGYGSLLLNQFSRDKNQQ